MGYVDVKLSTVVPAAIQCIKLVQWTEARYTYVTYGFLYLVHSAVFG